MKTLYIGVALYYEIGSSFLIGCSLDKSVILFKLNKWLVTEREYGNSVDYKICQLECSDELLKYLTSDKPSCVDIRVCFNCSIVDNASTEFGISFGEYINDVLNFTTHDEFMTNSVALGQTTLNCAYYAKI